MILKLDLCGIREGLMNGAFTSWDLVQVFGRRCYTIGRELCLTAEENFDEAIEEAKKKDMERQEAL